MKTYQSILPSLALAGVLLLASACEESDISIKKVKNQDLMLTQESVMIPEHTICETIDFEEFEAGDIVSSVNVLGGTVSVFGESPRSAFAGLNNAMIFDSSNPTGGDPDLGSATLGNILIVSEDRNSSDPDDEQRVGAKLFFDASGLDGTVYFRSIDLKDIEESETGEAAYIRIYGENNVLLEEKLLDATGDGGEVTEMLDYVAGGIILEVDFLGSGGIDNLEVCIIDIPEDGCSRTLGYYKNHLDAWCFVNPNDAFFSSGLTYLEAIKASVEGDPYLNLAQQYIAAVLNVCNGAPTPTEVQDAIETAESYFESGSVGEDWEEVKDTLDEYNNGVYPGTISCDALEEEEEEEDD